MKTIPLGGKYSELFIICDDEDFEILNQYKWTGSKGGNTIYAITTVKRKLFKHIN